MKEIRREEVLRKLNIKNFSELTSDKYDMFTSFLPKMNPEVAKKALEEVPELVSLSKVALDKADMVIEKGLHSNDSDNNNFYNVAENDSNALRGMLNNENLSFEEKLVVIDRLMDILKMLADKNTENKKFIFKMTVLFVGIVVFVITIVASIFGLKIRIPLGKIIQAA